MKVSTWRRLTALLLCIVMLLGLFVTTAPEAYAAGTDGEASAVDWPQITGLNVTDGYVYDKSPKSNSTVACKVKNVTIKQNATLDKTTIAEDNIAGSICLTVESPVTVTDGVVNKDKPAEMPGFLRLVSGTYTITAPKEWTSKSGEVWTVKTSADEGMQIFAKRVGTTNTYKTTTSSGAAYLSLSGHLTATIPLDYRYLLEVTVEGESSTTNTAPAIKSGVTNPATAETAVNTAWTLNLASIFEDADGDTLTYKVKVNDAAPVAADASYSYTPTAVGDTKLVFTANDSKVDSSEAYTVTLMAKISGYKITSTVEGNHIMPDKNPYPMGVVEVKVDNETVSEAEAGVTVVANAVAQKYTYASVDLYDAEFDHWEVSGITGIEMAALKNSALSFTMPTNDISLKAVFKEKGSSITVISSDFAAGDVDVGICTADTKIPVCAPLSTYDRDLKTHATATKTIIANAVVTFTTYNRNYNYKLISWEVKNTTTNEDVTIDYVGTNSDRPIFTVDGTSSYTIKAIFEAKDYANVNVTVNDAAMGTATAQVGTADASTSLTAVTEETTVTLHAAPADGFIFKSWKATYGDDGVVTVTDSDKADASFVMPATDKKPISVVATFEKDPEKLSKECALTDAVLLDGDGNPLGRSDRSGTNYTITVPADTDTDKLGELTLKLTASAYATVKKVGEKKPWPAEGKACGMELDALTVFVVTAEDGTTENAYTITIKQEAAPDAPTLSDGSAVRIDNKSATVTFTSSEAGTYFYSVVADNAAAPDIATTGSDDTASAGSNTITLTNLTEDARDIYIVVKNASGVESAPLKVDIPAYGDSTVPDTGAYSITYSGPKGGKLVPSRTKADEGDTITVTAVPDSGYQMVAGSMTYTLAVSGGTTTKITGNQFTMPEGDVTLSCQWETASVTTTSGITAFTINGVSAAVNNTTNVITITLPRGTDVTKLTPVISTSGVKSLSPASGKTVDFTNSVAYTATMDDGSTKTYTVTVYVDKGSLADQFWDKLTDFYNQTPWWQYAEHQQSTKKYPKYW